MLTPLEKFSTEGVKYCYVVRPGSDKTEFPLHEQCELPKIDKELEANGIWNVVAGIEGKTEELQFEVNVATEGMYIYVHCTYMYIVINYIHIKY